MVPARFSICPSPGPWWSWSIGRIVAVAGDVAGKPGPPFPLASPARCGMARGSGPWWSTCRTTSSCPKIVGRVDGGSVRRRPGSGDRRADGPKPRPALRRRRHPRLGEIGAGQAHGRDRLAGRRADPMAARRLETFYRVSAGRGSLLDGVAGIVVHDHWKPYFTMQGVCTIEYIDIIKAGRYSRVNMTLTRINFYGLSRVRSRQSLSALLPPRQGGVSRVWPSPSRADHSAAVSVSIDRAWTPPRSSAARISLTAM